MRSAFFKNLVALAEEDPKIHLIVGDLGFGSVEPFAERFPDRFLNAGVAEQNMMGIATGMALSGKTVFVYSISNFPTLRCLEQIRNDICFHGANVKIVTVGAGFSYGSLGMSHHVTEDLAVMRALPGMTILSPGDPREAAFVTRSAAMLPGPCYLRLARAGEPVSHPEGTILEIGRAALVRPGQDLTLIVSGGLLASAVRIAALLEEQCRLGARVLSMHTIKPLDTEAILAAARETRAVFTLEEHSILGGLGGAVAEILAEFSERKILFKRFGVPSEFAPTAGDQAYLQHFYGLSESEILKSLKSILMKVEK